ncbi:RimJ/RimL family protein N-acetyltransferase [Metabacillus crassostreae]|nr:GNAT family protein [Metabacillus crassostreae]MBM7602940.1 RimJ/RimL family protein N-acetyltransferase [Metabacillus crassostreae]
MLMFEKLAGNTVTIVPMEFSHTKELYEAGKHKEIWAHLPKSIMSYQQMEFFVEDALRRKELGNEIPFVIKCRESNKVIGSTRFLDISKINRGLEIGWTWLTPTVWGTDANLECKYLLLKYTFEHLNFIRVQFKTDDQNLRSQKAIEKIGGNKEGILRNHMIRKDGTYRHSVYYSIIDSEWKQVKISLENSLY